MKKINLFLIKKVNKQMKRPTLKKKVIPSELDEYHKFLAHKLIVSEPSGFQINCDDLPDNLYDYQKDLVKWACARGKAACFTMTGTGKTHIQAAWANCIYKKTNENILIVAPLAVAKQTVRLAKKLLDIDINYCREYSQIKKGITIINYEMLSHFEDCKWAGIVLDESSVLKSFSGKTRNMIIEYCQTIPYRLACTATPAPNDYMEIGNHAEFLNIMRYSEMLATFFVHDGGDTSKWRLKGHAKDDFWAWLATWSVFLNKPSDLGYSDEGFELPPLNTFQHIVESTPDKGRLFAIDVHTLNERRNARRNSLNLRVEKCIEIVEKSEKPFVIWCDLNVEADALQKAFPKAVEVRGSDTIDFKEKAILDFCDGKIPILISKSSIFGFGLNLQICSNTAFVGLSDSFESLFQTTKRFHRQGQTKSVNRHFIISEAENTVLQNITRKEKDFEAMIANMILQTKHLSMENIKQLKQEKLEYKADKSMVLPKWLKGE